MNQKASLESNQMPLHQTGNNNIGDIRRRISRNQEAVIDFSRRLTETEEKALARLKEDPGLISFLTFDQTRLNFHKRNIDASSQMQSFQSSKIAFRVALYLFIIPAWATVEMLLRVCSEFLGSEFVEKVAGFLVCLGNAILWLIIMISSYNHAKAAYLELQALAKQA